MLIYDDIYSWEGWGGMLRLASGKCRLRIFDLKKGNEKRLQISEFNANKCELFISHLIMRNCPA